MAKKILRAYSVDQPLVDVPHLAINSSRAPTAVDRDFAIGDPWIHKTDADNATMYNFGGLDSSQDAIWILAGPGDSEVDTLQGDSGGAIAPTAGNIVMTGGTNITTVGTAGPGTITFNLDGAITLATSVTSALYTTAAGTDLLITAVTGQDIVLKMGDAGGANKVSFTDSADVEVFSVDSDGALTFSSLVVTGAFTQSGGTASLNASSTFNTVINSGTSSGTVTIGNSVAGAITIDSGAGISLDAAAASNFTTAGAGIDIDIISGAGRVIVTAGEDAADAIYLHADAGVSETIRLHSDQGTGVASVHLESDVGGVTLTSGLASADAINLSATAGGVDIDGALQVNIASSQNAADAVRINASAGGIDIDAAGAAGEDITIDNAAGSIVITAAEAAADALVINASGGGIDITAATNDLDIVATAASANLSGGEADAAAVRINASNAGGGMDIDAGTLGIAIDSTGAISIDAAAASNFSVSGAGIDLNFASSAGRIIATSGEDAADSIYLHADAGSSETIRLHSDQGTGVASVALVSDVGGVTLTSGLASADAINLSASAGGVDIDGALEINIASSQVAATAVNIVASDAAGGITMTAGTGNVNVAGNFALTSVATQMIMNGGAVTDFIGQATLVNGEITVSNTNIATTDRIFVGRSAINASTALGMPLTTIVNSTSFKIEAKSLVTPANDETGDQSTFDYVIIRQS